MPATRSQPTTSADHAAFYQKHGYCVARGLVRPDVLVDLTRDFDRMVAQITRGEANANGRWDSAETSKLDGGAPTVVIHTHQVQKFSSAWLRFMLAYEPFLDLAQALVGPDIILHHTKLFQKPAGNGAPFPAHQDWQYFPTEQNSMLAATVWLTKATDAEGCLRVFPGSHRLGRLQQSNGHGGTDFAARFPLADSLPLEVEPGDVAFFNYLTVHASLPNRSANPRKHVLVQMHAGSDQQEAGVSHPNSGLALRGWNHRMTRDGAGAATG